MTGHRYYVMPADGSIAAGYDRREVAELVALDYGEGAHIVDTMAMPYHPVAQRVENGRPVYLDIGGWDVRGSLDDNLIEAAKKGCAPIVRAFLAKGADIDAADANGGTALIWAAARGVADVVELLIRCGADLDVRDSGGMSALTLARARNRAAIVTLLEAAGARE